MTDHIKLLNQMETELRLKQIVHDKEHERLRALMVEKHGEPAVQKVERMIKGTRDD